MPGARAVPGSVHLVLVGTSLIRNAYRVLSGGGAGGCTTPQGCLELLRVCGGDPRARDEKECCRRLSSGEARDCLAAVACLLDRDPYGMSAELNAMDWVLEKGCTGVDRVVLYASDTPEGRLAAEMLAAWLRPACRGAEVEAKVIQGLGKQPFWTGLVELAIALARDAREAYLGDRLVYLNATGGFKPESAAALLAAQAVAPVHPYYKHEAMRETVVLPYIPLALDRGRLRALRGKLHAAAETGEASPEESPELAWILGFLEASGLATRASDGRLRLSDKAREILLVMDRVYEELEKMLS